MLATTRSEKRSPTPTPQVSAGATCTAVKEEVRSADNSPAKNILEISVPDCVDKIVITKNGKKVIFEL